MGLRRLLQLLLHGDRRSAPRTPDASAALRRKQMVEQRVRRLEMDLQVHTGKPKK